jgi:group II intron reverse transcriptase/maturase
MAELLDRALSPPVFNAAWKRLRNEKTVWTPGVARWDMENDLALHLLQLQEDLRKGSYRPAPLRQFTIEKGDGKQRVLTALSLRDKLAQRAVLTVLEPLGERLFHNDSYGYRPKRNREMALRRACERINCGLPWLVDADIRSFFDEIPHRLLLKAIKQYIPDRELRHLIGLWLAEGASSKGFFSARRGIAQGAIISPFLCNLYLHQLDLTFTNKNIPFVRFADDFLLFSPDKKGANEILKFIEKQLEKLDLELHWDKTKIEISSPKIIFLGYNLPKPMTAGEARGKGAEQKSKLRKGDP